MSEREMMVQEKDSQRGVENEKGHQNQKDDQNKKCDSESGVGARREQNKDMMEIEQTKDQGKEKGESLKVLDQNRVKDCKEEREGMRTDNARKWKRRIRQSQWEKEISIIRKTEVKMGIQEGCKERQAQRENRKKRLKEKELGKQMRKLF